jgi:hypothetical protein
MKDPLTRLTEKTATLGNYNLKYLHIISSHVERLTTALEQQGKRDQVHLWSYSTEIPGEMDTVLAVASGTGEALDFLSCYYALQFLHMNLRMLDIVKLELATSPRRPQTGRKLMLEAGRMFRLLTKSYMERLLDIFIEGRHVPEFVMLGVGTRSDQDDIDVGIVHRGEGDIDILNYAISRLASRMLKTATRLHFHLSEHIGERSLTATIEEYEEILDTNRYDFVIVAEMIGAANILGSNALFEEFKTRVTDRFYYNPREKENRFHEGYLRGILGEARTLLTRPTPEETINPKEDGLRAIKMLLSALKLVYGVRKVIAWNIIDGLREKNPERTQEYDDLERTLSFFETFRHLYQIMVAQDEDIGLHDPSIEAMVARIAEMIGFEKRGVVSAKDSMLVIYYEFLEKSIKAIEVLTGDLKSHMRAVSVYTPIFSGEIHRKPGYKGNLAFDFIRASTFSEGITYWDDFLEELNAEDNAFFDEFIESMNELPDKIRSKIARGYVSGTKYDPASILRFLLVLGRKAESDKAKGVFNELSKLFIEELVALPNPVASLIRITHAYPEILNGYLALLEWESLSRLMELARTEPSLPELVPHYGQLIALLNVHYQSSHFFKRHFYPILDKYPVFIRNLHINDRLKEITDGILGDLTSLGPIDERFERLGDYYDMEFVRVSLLAMAGIDCEHTDTEFIEFCDNYTLSLYELCQHDVHLALGYSMHTRDRFALYAAGGLAREQGFDDDYDMIAILNSTDTDEIDYCNRIVARMNTHILKRGILPHHRFADHFGSYVINLDQLADHLSGASEDVFVDMSQILGSRILVGSGKLEIQLQERIIEPCIFGRGHEYIEYMKEEMKARHVHDDPEQCNNIKECRGGLRDIEMLLLMYKTKHHVRDPLTRKFLKRLIENEPDHAEAFSYIEQHLNFLKNLRDLYRLKVAATDIIDRENIWHILPTAEYDEEEGAADRLYDDFQKRTCRAAEIIDELAAAVNV